jgi:hypothetical protein
LTLGLPKNDEIPSGSHLVERQTRHRNNRKHT